MPGSMINISMKSIGQEPEDWAKQVAQDFHWELQNELFILGEKAHALMLGTIKSNIKRDGSTGNLEKSIEYKFDNLANHCGFWIGDIDFLNANAKYWHWLNYGVAQSGRTTPPKDFGYFEGSKWIHMQSNEKSFWMTPTKPIEAINYIETAIFQLEQDIPEMLAKLDKKLEGNKSGKSGKQWWGSKIDFNPEGFKGSSQHTYGGG